ncbi:hypothetical protein UR09_00395 [Candidatus Nitromaritima sp. SCGC AAA799-A02]|nr:hypothetical protein UR09_00395 [Candidatus Nitromaritima sp. SCGC AAA799-A02]
MQENHDNLRPFWLTLTLLPIVVYYLAAWQYTLNIPFWDDYDFLEDTLKIQESNRFSDQIVITLGQEGEHRTAFLRIIFLTSVLLRGDIDFTLLAFLGNMALLGLLWFLLKLLPKSPWKLLSSLPIVLLLFQFQNWNNMIWTAAVLQHFTILYFAGGAFYWIVKRSRGNFISALFHASIACFTHGSGLAVSFLCALYLFGAKRTRDAWVWLGWGVLIFSIYFYDYKISSQGSTFWVLLQSPGLLAARFFSFLGSILAFKQFSLSIVLGVAVFSYFIFLTQKKYYSKNPCLYFFMTFILLSALAVAVFRSDLGVSQALTYRYKIYSAVLWIMVYLSFLELCGGEKILSYKTMAMFIFLTVTIYALSILDAKPKIEFQRDMMVYRLNHWALNNNSLFFHDQTAANGILSSAIERGIYHPPNHLLSISEESRSKIVENDSICQEELKSNHPVKINGFPLGTKGNPVLYRMEGMIRLPEVSVSADSPIYLVLQSNDRRILLTARKQENPEMSTLFQADSKNVGIISLISLQYLKEGPFQAGLCFDNKVVFPGFQVSLSSL